jgi:hypothetical protein
MVRGLKARTVALPESVQDVSKYDVVGVDLPPGISKTSIRDLKLLLIIFPLPMSQELLLLLGDQWALATSKHMHFSRHQYSAHLDYCSPSDL